RPAACPTWSGPWQSSNAIWHDDIATLAREETSGFAPRLSPPHPRHLLQHRAYRGGIVRGVTGRHRGVVDRPGRGKQRRRDAESFGEFADHLHVLLPDRELHGCFVIPARGHHWRAQLEHARGAGANPDHLVDGLRIEAGRHSE